MRAKVVAVVFLMFVSISVSARAQESSARMPASDLLHSVKLYLVSLSVADLDETLKWYQNNLGFTVLEKKDLPKYSLRIAFIQLNGFVLELVEFTNSVSEESIRKRFPEVDDRAKIQGFGKLAFWVDDVDAMAGLLKSKQVNFVRNVEQDDEIFHTKWFIVTDNSGNWIQFFQKH